MNEKMPNNASCEYDDESYDKVDESFKSLSLDNLYSSDGSVHTLESTISCIADDDRDAKDSSPRTLYQMQDKRAMEQLLQKVKIQSFDGEDPYLYDMYHNLRESFSSADGTTVSTESLEVYDAYLAGVRHPAITKSSSGEEAIDSIDHTSTAKATFSRDSKATFSRDSTVYTTQTALSREDHDAGNAFGGCFCLNIFEGDEDNDSNPYADNESVLVEKNKSTAASTLSHDERMIRKERLKQKLASMDPKAAQAFKKKLLQEKIDKDLNSKGDKNVSQELLKIQAQYVQQMQVKRRLKANQKQEKERGTRKDRKLEVAREKQRQLEAEASSSSSSGGDTRSVITTGTQGTLTKKKGFFRRRVPDV